MKIIQKLWIWKYFHRAQATPSKISFRPYWTWMTMQKNFLLYRASREVMQGAVVQQRPRALTMPAQCDCGAHQKQILLYSCVVLPIQWAISRFLPLHCALFHILAKLLKMFSWSYIAILWMKEIRQIPKLFKPTYEIKSNEEFLYIRHPQTSFLLSHQKQKAFQKIFVQ